MALSIYRPSGPPTTRLYLPMALLSSKFVVSATSAELQALSQSLQSAFQLSWILVGLKQESQARLETKASAPHLELAKQMLAGTTLDDNRTATKDKAPVPFASWSQEDNVIG